MADYSPAVTVAYYPAVTIERFLIPDYCPREPFGPCKYRRLLVNLFYPDGLPADIDMLWPSRPPLGSLTRDNLTMPFKDLWDAVTDIEEKTRGYLFLEGADKGLEVELRLRLLEQWKKRDWEKLPRFPDEFIDSCPNSRPCILFVRGPRPTRDLLLAKAIEEQDAKVIESVQPSIRQLRKPKPDSKSERRPKNHWKRFHRDFVAWYGSKDKDLKFNPAKSRPWNYKHRFLLYLRKIHKDLRDRDSELPPLSTFLSWMKKVAKAVKEKKI